MLWRRTGSEEIGRPEEYRRTNGDFERIVQETKRRTNEE